MISADQNIESAPHKGPGRPRSVDEAALARAAELIRGGRTLREAARETGIPLATLSTRLKLGRTPGRRRVLTADQISTARTMLAAKTPFTVIVRELGVNEATLRRALKRTEES